jgi:signal transduction histidine kinase
VRALSRRAALERLRRPPTTVRWRLTLLYGLMFLVCGAGLLAITYVLLARDTTVMPGRFFERSVGGLPTPPSGRADIRNAYGAVRVPPGVVRTLQSQGGQKAVSVIVRQQRVFDLHQLEVESGIALAIMALLSTGLGWFVAGRVLRPLRTITAATRAISETTLDQRLALDGPRDELRQLADTIDGLLGRLEAAFDAQRRFVANASHELRTPLSAVRAVVELALSDPHPTVAGLRAAAHQVLEENEQQEQLIEALLALAQGERGLAVREPVELEPIVRGELARRKRDLDLRGLGLQRTLGVARVSGDRRLITRLVANLLDNAIRHNVPGGELQVSLGESGGVVRLKVANSGPVVPPEEIERLLQPFQRLASTRTGHGEGVGLGLSIIAAVVRAHGGALEVLPRPGGGLAIRVELPSGRPAPPPAPGPPQSSSATVTTPAGASSTSTVRRAASATWIRGWSGRRSPPPPARPRSG